LKEFAMSTNPQKPVAAVTPAAAERDRAKESKTCAVIGVGPGLGTALVRRFAAEYTVAIVARNADYLAQVAGEIATRGGRAHPVPANTADESAIAAAFETIRRELGDPEVLIYNAAMRPFGRLMETKPSTFENTWRVNAFGAFLCSQQVVPAMLKAGRGTIIFTGATAGVRPFPTSAAFGPAKFALHGLAQVMARDLQPQGIHVAYVNVDGAIDMPFIRQRFPELKDEDMLKPSAIADAYWLLAHQDRSAWTHELDVRPFKEKF
jgi:NAD(P)-dependent dehydrogenase (short-subunit alcohol dehydrogenase family)